MAPFLTITYWDSLLAYLRKELSLLYTSTLYIILELAFILVNQTWEALCSRSSHPYIFISPSHLASSSSPLKAKPAAQQCTWNSEGRDMEGVYPLVYGNGENGSVQSSEKGAHTVWAPRAPTFRENQRFDPTLLLFPKEIQFFQK